MNGPCSITRSLCSALLVLSGLTSAIAQTPCDSLNEVGFTYSDNGAYNYTFSSITPSIGSTIQSMEWGFLGEDFMDFSFALQPQVTFPGMNDYMICLRTNVLNAQTGMCESIHCELVSIPVDYDCAGVVAEFTISAQGGIIQFSEESLPGLSYDSYAWDFGDGTTSTQASPQHTYAGTGPYEACLTVTTATCSATACNWIYLGPSDVPCATLLQPAIGVIQYEKTIAVFDQSITSGMYSSITWDFGDGTTATGSPVIHTYTDENNYEVCGEVDLWGPLTLDTCSSSACEYIYIYTAAGIGSHSSDVSLRAFPIPFTQELTVEGVEAGEQWELVDMLGRIHLQGSTPTVGALVIPAGKLDAGNYLLRTIGPSRTGTLKVVKSSSTMGSY